MSFAARLNDTLTRATGFRITRTRHADAPATPASPPRRPAGTADKGRRRRTRTLPADYDELSREVCRLVEDRTMTGHPKVNFLSEAVRYVVRHGIPGAMVECGVWRGGSMLAVAHTLSAIGATDRDLYLFDTFTGMSAPSERDVNIRASRSADEMLAARDRGAPIWEVATLEDVQEGFAAVDYPAERLHFVPGKVEDTVPEHAPEQIAVLRLDTDWYESTKHELEHLYPRLAPGGVLIIDDYGSWQGSKDATDEFLETTGEPLMLTRVARGRVAIKPGLSSTC
jgi:O-methyltransferase